MRHPGHRIERQHASGTPATNRPPRHFALARRPPTACNPGCLRPSRYPFYPSSCLVFKRKASNPSSKHTNSESSTNPEIGSAFTITASSGKAASKRSLRMARSFCNSIAVKSRHSLLAKFSNFLGIYFASIFASTFLTI